MSDASSHPNVVRYRRMMEAFNRNDLSTVQDLVAPNVDYVVPGRSLIAGRTTDLPGLLGMLRRSKELSEGTLRLDVTSTVADDRFLFVYGRVRAERAGKTFDSEHCVVFQFDNGKIVAGRTVPVDLYAFDDFWS